MTRRLIVDQAAFDAMAARLAEPRPTYAEGGAVTPEKIFVRALDFKEATGYSIEEDATADGTVVRARWCCLRCASGQGEAPTRPAARRAAETHQMAAHGCETAVTA